MPKLPHLPRRSPPPGEAARLSRWFRERDLALRLWKEMPEEYAKALRSPPLSVRPRSREHADLVASFDKDLQVGQIRILHGGMFTEMRRPMHVAILSEWPPCETKHEKNRIQRDVSPNIILFSDKPGDTTNETSGEQSYLVAPFGDYHEPATTTEWLTGREAVPLRVLCLWNTRDYPARWLELGWKVDDLSEQELEDAWEVFRHSLTGVPLSDRLRQHVGAPIIHPRDPRLAYQEEEARLFTIVPDYAEHRLQQERAVQSNIVDFYPSPWRVPDESDEIVLAARSLETPALEFAKYAVGATQLVLRLLTQIDGNLVEVGVFDQTGHPSTALDGAQFSPRNGEAVRIENGKALCPRDAVLTGFKLISVQGLSLELKRVDS